MELDLDESVFWSLCKHGIGLTVLMFLMVFGWAVIMVVLVTIGSILGLIIGLGVFALALGYINSYLADMVWEMGTNDGVASMFFHGVLLFLVLLMVEIPILVINYMVPHWLIMVILFVIYVPIHGYVGVRVAEVFETSKNDQEDGAFYED